MNARYKYKIGDLVNCHLPESNNATKIFLGIVYARQRQRTNGWLENTYNILLQDEYQHDSMLTDKICLLEKALSKIK